MITHDFINGVYYYVYIKCSFYITIINEITQTFDIEYYDWKIVVAKYTTAHDPRLRQISPDETFALCSSLN